MRPHEKIMAGQALVLEGLAELGVTMAFPAGGPVSMSVPEAAALMGISEAACRARVNRGEVPGVVRTGLRVQFHRERLLAGLTKSRLGHDVGR